MGGAAVGRRRPVRPPGNPLTSRSRCRACEAAIRSAGPWFPIFCRTRCGHEIAATVLRTRPGSIAAFGSGYRVRGGPTISSGMPCFCSRCRAARGCDRGRSPRQTCPRGLPGSIRCVVCGPCDGVPPRAIATSQARQRLQGFSTGSNRHADLLPIHRHQHFDHLAGRRRQAKSRAADDAAAGVHALDVLRQVAPVQ